MCVPDILFVGATALIWIAVGAPILAECFFLTNRQPYSDKTLSAKQNVSIIISLTGICLGVIAILFGDF